MPQAINEVEKSRTVEHSSLSNIQMELIKLYSTNLNHDELMELKELLICHFSQVNRTLLRHVRKHYPNRVL